MKPGTIFALIIAILVLISFYLLFGMAGTYDYNLKGWFFAPARFLRKFFCGMFIGHEYKDGKCKHCFKKEKN